MDAIHIILGLLCIVFGVLLKRATDRINELYGALEYLETLYDVLLHDMQNREDYNEEE